MEENYIWNSYVLRHEADELGIAATDEIVEAVQKIPALTTNGVYDSNKYNQFVERASRLARFTTDLLEGLVATRCGWRNQDASWRDGQAAIGEIRAMYEQRNQKTDVSVIRLKLEDFKKGVKISDEDVQKRFEEKETAPPASGEAQGEGRRICSAGSEASTRPKRSRSRAAKLADAARANLRWR